MLRLAFNTSTDTLRVKTLLYTDFIPGDLQLEFNFYGIILGVHDKVLAYWDV
jgi:hypothetical protein